MLPTLHLACMPFPTPQGTQALIAAMMAALEQAGSRAHLLTYAHGEGEAGDTHEEHRLVDRPRVRSARSGPSVGKAILDLRMVHEVRKVAAAASPSAVIAHNVEAAVVAALAGVAPRVYFAHTRFDAELPHYAPGTLRPLLEPAGRALDALACRGADHVIAVCPDLAASLSSRLGREVSAPALPWSLGPMAGADERRAARKALGVEGEDPVLLYAGNLDGYQGWEDAVLALGELPRARLLVATASDPGELLALATEMGLRGHLHLADLDSEEARRRAHAAADLAIVTRRAPGGLPIKLLDALSRGLPVVCSARATGGLALEAVVERVANDEPAALAEGVRRALPERLERAAKGRIHIEEAHAPSRFVADLEEAIERARRNHLERR